MTTHTPNERWLNLLATTARRSCPLMYLMSLPYRVPRERNRR